MSSPWDLGCWFVIATSMTSPPAGCPYRFLCLHSPLHCGPWSRGAIVILLLAFVPVLSTILGEYLGSQCMLLEYNWMTEVVRMCLESRHFLPWDGWLTSKPELPSMLSVGLLGLSILRILSAPFPSLLLTAFCVLPLSRTTLAGHCQRPFTNINLFNSESTRREFKIMQTWDGLMFAFAFLGKDTSKRSAHEVTALRTPCTW